MVHIDQLTRDQRLSLLEQLQKDDSLREPAPLSVSSSSSQKEKRIQVVQTVASISTKAKVTKWMKGDLSKNVVARACEKFYGDLRTTTMPLSYDICSTEEKNRLRVRVRKWWKAVKQGPNVFTSAKKVSVRIQSVGKRSVHHHKTVQTKRRTGTLLEMLKPDGGRGRKMDKWKQDLLVPVAEHMDAARKFGVTVDRKIICVIVTVEYDGLYPRGPDETESAHANRRQSQLKQLVGKGSSFITTLKQRMNWVYRKKSGKPRVTGHGEVRLNQMMAYFFGEMKYAFDNKMISAEQVVNIDETGVQYGLQSAYTYNVQGEKNVFVANVTSSTSRFTTVLTARGGSGVNSGMKKPFLIFNGWDTFPSLPQIDGVTYRTNKRAWMTADMWKKFLAHQFHRSAEITFMFCDNCTSHSKTDEVNRILGSKNVVPLYLVPNTTHRLQPLDDCINSEFKSLLKEKLHSYYLLLFNKYEGGDRSGLTKNGNMKNPGKKWFLEMVRDCIKQVSTTRSKHRDVSIPQAAFIRCGLTPDNDGVWKVEQLSRELQEIVKQYLELKRRPQDYDSNIIDTIRAAVGVNVQVPQPVIDDDQEVNENEENDEASDTEVEEA